MPSQPRYVIIEDHSYFHVTWQCHNRDWLLNEDWAKKTYLTLLGKYKFRYKVKIFSYCLMSNHPHILGYCENKTLFSDFFRVVNSQFARIFNRRMKRRGQVVMDRFKSPRIQSAADLLKVMHYIELNPKRAKMIEHPRDYPWSSYRYYAHGEANPLLDCAPSYLSLGKTPEERQKTYRKMIEVILKNDWKVKKPYSSAPFIGNPDWVRSRWKDLREIRRSDYHRWKTEHRMRFEAG
jgi:REP-associated tyrosine transposase